LGKNSIGRRKKRGIFVTKGGTNMREKVYPRPLRRGVYRLVFTVERIEGMCPVHEVGDRIVVEDPELILEETDRVCTYALSSLLSSTSALAREVTPPDWVSSP
jgi:uncharacterized repeat protein (TIGR04076 family)